MSITPRDPADFTPTRGTYTELKPFRFWCQKVLPLVYDNSLSYYELLCKVVDFLNKAMEDVETLEGDVTSMYTAFEELQSYVNDYFSTLDVQTEIDNKLDAMAVSGALTALISPLLPALISDWLAENISPTTPPIDKTLTIENAGADAKVVGDRFKQSYKIYSEIINPSNYQTALPDLNGVSENCIYTLVPTSSGYPANMPADFVRGEYYTLRTSVTGSGVSGGALQELYDSAGNGWIRYRQNASNWFNWVNISAKIRSETLSNTYIVYSEIVNNTNFQTLLPDINLINENSVYTIVPTASGKPLNLPDDIPNNIFITLRTTLTPTNGRLQEIITQQNKIYYRYSTSSTTWDNWVDVLKNKYEIYPNIISPSNYQTLLPDLNNITENSVYTIVPTSTDHPNNMPGDFTNNDYHTLRTTITGYGSSGGALQELIDGTGKIWIRYRQNASNWFNWINIENKIKNDIIPNTYKIHSGIINSSNYATILPNIDNITENSVYTLVPSNNSEPAGLPSDIVPNEYYFLLTNRSGNNAGSIQILWSDMGEYWTRPQKNATSWFAWERHERQVKYTVAKTGGDFNSIFKAVRAVRKFKNPYIFVEDGVYDVIAEFEEVFGSSYFANYVRGYGNTQEYQGMNLYNGITLEFSSGAKMVCNYTGSNGEVRAGFSAINMFYGDATLINVKIEGSNIRYIVHDDPLVNKDFEWKHVYKNCNFKLDNSNALPSFSSKSCIGGGLGKHCTILIEDCIFNSIGMADNYTNVNYHNCILDGSISTVIVKNCYFMTGTFGATWYGPSTEKTNVIVTNCRLKSDVIEAAETAEYNIDNIDVFKWNNIIE